MPLQLKSLFGPVPSRRLGRSLGIDVIPPKTCTYDCVYCESGRTTELTARRREFTADDLVLNDLRCFFEQHAGGADVLTFSSAGEPTLHLGLGRLIERIKKDYPSLPLVVLTNGSLLWDPEVRKDLMRADRVIPSLDAATPGIFKSVDRPHPGLELDAILEGLYAFRRDYRGQLHLEVLLVRGMNDDPRELLSLRRVIDRVRPDCVELNTVVRPPACPGVRGLTREEMTAAAGYFPPDTIRVIGRFEPSPRDSDESESLGNRVLQLVTRRPCSVEEMADSLGVSLESLQETLSGLLDQKKIRPRKYDDRLFYCPSSES
jgi:wyosine [tRNA(Phe)-imidazoG37] synthetase (radical SAM superfamily)